MDATISNPLSPRLASRSFAIGGAALLIALGAAAAAVWYGSPLELAALAAAAPLVLLIGGAAWRKTSRLSAAIEHQLRRAADGMPIESALAPIAERDPVAGAWNEVVERLREGQWNDSLEARLSGSASAVDQQRWSGVFSALSDGLAVCDRKSTIVEANNALAALLQRPTPAELVGQSLLTLLNSAGGPSAAEQVARLSQGSVKRSEDILLGSEIAAGVLRVTRIPLPGEACGSTSTLYVVRDVTQQRLSEEMRSQFLATATHELRTPLTNIVAYADLLAHEEDLDLEKQKSFCNLINSEATRLSRFVDQLLNISQMEAGALSLVRHETDIARLAAEVSDNLQPQAAQKKIAFETNFPPKIPKLCVDKDKLAAALVNLLGNAVKYTPEGGRVTFQIELAATQVLFHVEDTGIGISADELPHLAEKFFRSSDSRVRQVTGTGLGLAFAQEVARLHGGALTVASELNKGSRFTLSLPLS